MSLSQTSRASGSPSPPGLTANTPHDILLKAALQLQADKNAIHAKLTRVRRRADELDDNNNDTSDHNSKRLKVAHNEDSDDGGENEDEDEVHSLNMERAVTKAGHKFLLVHCPFLHQGEDLFQINLQHNFAVDERFENQRNLEQGQLHEVFALLRSTFEEAALHQSWVARAFIKGLNTQKYNTASRIRNHCAKIFKVDDDELRDPALRRQKFRNRIGWTENNGGSYSSVDVEVIHRNYTGEYKLKDIFLNPSLMGLYIALIRGLTAAKDFMLDRRIVYPKTETMAKIHSIRNITPGAIAMSAILARWALSADDTLQEVGSSTQINYLKDYEEYLEILETGLRRKKKSVLDIIREWDDAIFPHTDSSLVGRRMASGIQQRKFKQVMEELDRDDEEPEEEEDQLDDDPSSAAGEDELASGSAGGGCQRS